MPLYGSSVPIDVNPADKPFAVLVICPNQYSHQRLLSALNEIVPEAATVTPLVVEGDAILGARCQGCEE